MLDFDIHVASADVRLQDRHAQRIACQVVRALRRDLVFPAAAAAQRGSEISLHVFTTVKAAPVAVAGQAGHRYGFHVLVPGVRVARGYKRFLLQLLRDDGPINGVLADLGALGDPRDCLDQNSASVPVLFLGSCKRGGAPYRLSSVCEVTFDAAFAPNAPPSDADFFPMLVGLRAEDLEERGYNLVAEASLCFESRYASGQAPLVPAWACSCRPELAPKVEDLARRARDGAAGKDELLFAEHSLSTLAVCDPEARYLYQVLDLLDAPYYTDRTCGAT